MKSLIILVSLFLVPPLAAQELEKSFQQEYVYLTSQKESLNRQKTQMESSFSSRLNKAKADVEAMQRRLTSLTAANDERHEELVELEKQKKELQKRGSSLESTYKKAQQSLTDLRKQLRFESSKEKEKESPVVPQDLHVSDLDPIFQDANSLLQAAARVETFEGYYLDEKDELKKGQVTRLGRVAAFLDDNGRKVMLGPNGMGSLKTLEPANGDQAYFFESLSEVAKIEKAATFVERLADAGPLLFLGAMLLMVTGLFAVLVRI